RHWLGDHTLNSSLIEDCVRRGLAEGTLRRPRRRRRQDQTHSLTPVCVHQLSDFNTNKRTQYTHSKQRLNLTNKQQQQRSERERERVREWQKRIRQTELNSHLFFLLSTSFDSFLRL